MSNAQALYVHVPFCEHICAYCDFCRVIYQPKLIANYLTQLSLELKAFGITDYQTIYLGGGTPSALSVAELTTLFEILAPYAQQVQEYTIEANPESVTLAKIALFNAVGINRVSLGVQVTQHELLASLGRRHSFAQVQTVINNLQASGITNISVDLMYGIPDQSKAQVLASLQACLALNIKHLSLYTLTIEPNSVFGRLGVLPIDDETDVEIFTAAQAVLAQAGFNQYEVSNFALAGYESKHNLVYWHYADFIGIGAGAAGKIGSERYQNACDLVTYLADPFASREWIGLSLAEQKFEYLLMNLRLKTGFLLTDYETCFNSSFNIDYANEIQKLISQKLLVCAESCYCSEAGLLLLNQVLLEFISDDK